MALARMRHDTDPREDILVRLADLYGVDVFNDMVLVAVYERPAKTASGIVLPDQTREEDRYQGKAALVVKTGPLVNVGDTQARGGELKAGDWIAIRPSDGWAITINKVLCRMISEKGVHLRIPSPDAVY